MRNFQWRLYELNIFLRMGSLYRKSRLLSRATNNCWLLFRQQRERKKSRNTFSLGLVLTERLSNVQRQQASSVLTISNFSNIHGTSLVGLPSGNLLALGGYRGAEDLNVGSSEIWRLQDNSWTLLGNMQKVNEKK